MSDDRKIEAINVKLTAQQFDRIDALIDPMTEAGRRMGIRDMTRASVVRAAVERGLDVLEREFLARNDASRDDDEEPGHA
jgi:hypothetical protein